MDYDKNCNNRRAAKYGDIDILRAFVDGPNNEENMHHLLKWN